MKTDDLISVLAAGASPIAPGAARRRLMLGLLVGMVGAAALVFGLLRPHHLGQAAGSGSFWMKIGYSFWLGVGGYLLVDRAARPGMRAGAGTYVVGAGLAAIATLAVMNMIFMPVDHWRAAWMGRSALFCPIAILIVAVPIFLAVCVAMRGLAPTQLRWAGAAAGLLAGGMGAAMYALWCREPAAMFVATWYTLAVGICAGIGALVGPKILRW